MRTQEMTRIMMKNRPSRWLPAALALLGAVACDDGDDPDVSIESPEHNTILTAANDADPATPGIQVDVVASVRSEEEGADVWLFTNALRLDSNPDAEPDVIQPLPSDGRVTFRVTLAEGVHELLACVRDCSERSMQVRVTVSDSCSGIVFVDPTPALGGDATYLGPDNDVDGEACGPTFTTNVRVGTIAPDGTMLQLWVNGTASATTTASGGFASFTGIVLGNRGDTPNTLAVQVAESAGGGICRQEFPTPLFVDCDGTSCAITLPDTDRDVLNSNDDVSMAPGFQTDFEVTADVETAGQSTNLIVDGNILTNDSVSSGGAAVTQFAAVDLAEGRHSVVAECKDLAGNITRTAPAIWTVDTVGCQITIVLPEGDTLFIGEDDEDPVTEGIQITANGTISGDRCETVVIGPCGAAEVEATINGSMYEGLATLASTAMQDLCAVVTDESGNTTEARVRVQVRTDAPQLAIISPAPATQFNRLGNDGFVADLDPSTASCEIEFQVECSEVGVDVELRQTLTDISVGTSPCEGTPGMMGLATFPMTSISSLDDGTSVNVYARQEVDRVIGTSVPIEIVPDCAAPDLDFLDPVCPGVLRPSQDDSAPGAPGFQYTVRVLNPPVNNVDLTTLTATDGGGGTVSMDTSMSRSGQVIVFTNFDFGAGGVLNLEACATDPVGNRGCSTLCEVSVLDLPQLSISAPTPNAGLNASNDCDPGRPGIQVQVRATTDAADSAPASIIVGSLPAQPVTISGGVIDACVDGQEGRDVAISVEVMVSEGTARATVLVNIDATPPTATITDLSLASVVDRRGGIVRLQYTAIPDADGASALQGTEVRCSLSPITSEADWDSAEAFFTRTPAASPGSIVAEDVPGFLPGVDYYCVARSFDVGGGLSPLPAGGGVQVGVDFRAQTVELATSIGMGDRIVPVGDVDGDLLPDFLIGGAGRAYLFFGRTGLTPTTPVAPNVTFEGGVGFAGPDFGSIAGIGDVNDDGIADFAIGSGQENSAYIFFGRASRAAWDATTIMVSAAACPANAQALCIRGEAMGDFFGFRVDVIGDFDGDGIDDVGIGAPGMNGFQGAEYIIRGSRSFGTSMSASVSTLSGFVVRSTAAPMQQFIGFDTASVGDVTSDGRADIFITGAGSAAVNVISRLRRVNGRSHSGTMTLNRIEWDTLTELSTGSAARYAVQLRSVGDVNNNGTVDLSAYSVVPGGGYLEIFTGESNFMMNFRITNDVPSDAAGDDFGAQTATGFHPVMGRLGQIDNVAGPELLTGSTQLGTETGDARMWYSPVAGATTRLSAPVVLRPEVAGGEISGRKSTGFIGDVNGDGHRDLAVGEPSWPTGDTTGRGRVTIYY